MFLLESHQVELVLSDDLARLLFESLKFFTLHFVCLQVTKWLS